MKTLYLIRHAKSSWSNPNLTDHDRPLNKRGERDKITMAKFAKAHFGDMEIIYSSSAVRAQEYAVCLNKFTGVDLQVREVLYTFDLEVLWEFIRTMSDDYSEVALVTHNPAVTEVLNRIADLGNEEKITNLPTASIAKLEMDLESWADMVPGIGRIADFARPKSIAKK